MRKFTRTFTQTLKKQISDQFLVGRSLNSRGNKKIGRNYSLKHTSEVIYRKN